MSSPQNRHRSRLLLVFALAALIVGCAQLPSQPRVEPASSTANVTAPASDLLGLVGGIVKGLISITTNVVGEIGGVLTNGRWRVEIPAGAIDGNAVVRVGVAEPGSPECELEITPVSKNHFRVPVTLTIDCRNVSDSELRNYVIYWSDPVAKRWVEVPGSKVDLAHKTVSAPLSHFSTYSVGPKGGKAGW